MGKSRGNLPAENRQVRLKSRPVGIPQAEHFEIVAEAMPTGPLPHGKLLVRNHFLSVDPAMRHFGPAQCY